MALNASGQISIGGSTAGQSINLELGLSATATSTMNDAALRSLAGVASGAISLSNFYGKSSAIGYGFSFTGSTGAYFLSKLTYSTGTGAFQSNPSVASNQSACFTFDAPSNGTAIFAGGYGSGKATDIWGIVLSSSTYSAIAAALPVSMGNSAAATNSNATQGYIIGYRGTGGGGYGNNNCYKINLSTYSTALLAAKALKPTYTYNQASNSGGAHSATLGYSICGTEGQLEGGSYVDVCDTVTTLNFSNDTTTTIGAYPGKGGSHSNTQNKTAVYNWGTNQTNGYNTNPAYKLTFSTATYVTFSGNAAFTWGGPNSARQWGTRGCSNNVRGFLVNSGGGTTTGYVAYLTFATETKTNNVSLGSTLNGYNTFSFIGQHVHLQ